MKGILFKEELFKKTLSSEKIATRRRININPWDYVVSPTHELVTDSARIIDIKEKEIIQIIKPRYKKDEVVYLKESATEISDTSGKIEIVNTLFKYDLSVEDRKRHKWTNKLFMPASDARHFIKIMKVYVERLQWMEEEQYVEEGFLYDKAFHNAWDKINKAPYKWSDNPWVWVYEYELLDFHGKGGEKMYEFMMDGVVHTWNDKNKTWQSDNLPF